MSMHVRRQVDTKLPHFTSTTISHKQKKKTNNNKKKHFRIFLMKNQWAVQVNQQNKTEKKRKSTL